MQLREEYLQKLRNNPQVSVLIVGAGVNGIGTFRDLALQGVDVLLIDKGDFCSGASAASSHMVHGGIRYLENGEFRLVREAVQERNLLLQNAPHYVKPLPTVIPVFKWFSGMLNAPLKFFGMLNKPSERGAIIIKLGLIIYDFFTRKQGTVPHHTFKNHRNTMRDFPSINPDVLFTAHYYDGKMLSPERICVEMVLDAEEANSQAIALNYMSLSSAWGNEVTITDQITSEQFIVRPKIVINATGAWVDIANKKMNLKTQLIGGTKGSHLVLDSPELRSAIGENEFFFENKDGRIVLILPLLDKVMVGTTDIPLDDPEDVTCTEEEIDYFLKMIPIVFPNIPISRDQIVFRFSGVRPLPFTDAADAGQISRDHAIHVCEPDTLSFPVYNLVGGKWTSFRAFSAEVTDRVLAALSLPRKTSTKELAIGGGRDYPITKEQQDSWIKAVQAETGLAEDRLNTLFERYGTRAKQVAEFIAQSSDSPLYHLQTFSVREMDFLVLHEKIVHLDDFFLHRSNIAKLGLITSDNLNEIADVIGKKLDWTSDAQKGEIARIRGILRDNHGVEVE